MPSFIFIIVIIDFSFLVCFLSLHHRSSCQMMNCLLWNLVETWYDADKTTKHWNQTYAWLLIYHIGVQKGAQKAQKPRLRHHNTLFSFIYNSKSHKFLWHIDVALHHNLNSLSDVNDVNCEIMTVYHLKTEIQGYMKLVWIGLAHIIFVLSCFHLPLSSRSLILWDFD